MVLPFVLNYFEVVCIGVELIDRNRSLALLSSKIHYPGRRLTITENREAMLPFSPFLLLCHSQPCLMPMHKLVASL